MLPGAAYALLGDCVVGFGGPQPRLSLFFLARARWKTLALVSPRDRLTQEGSASLLRHVIVVEAADARATLFALGGSTFPRFAAAPPAFLRAVSCPTAQLARCQRVPAGLFPRFPDST